MPSFRWSTEAQLRSALRERFAQATGLQACQLADAILSRGMADAEMRALFASTDPQLRSKLVTMQTAAANVADKVGF